MIYRDTVLDAFEDGHLAPEFSLGAADARSGLAFNPERHNIWAGNQIVLRSYRSYTIGYSAVTGHLGEICFRKGWRVSVGPTWERVLTPMEGIFVF